MISDRTEGLISGTDNALPFLIESANRLKHAGAEILCICCNTAHCYIDIIEGKTGVEFLNMVEITGQYIRFHHYSSALVLATEGTVKTDVYGRILRSMGINCIYPEFQEAVNSIIYDGVKKLKTDYDCTDLNKRIASIAINEKAAVVLGCTELPVAVDTYNLYPFCIDPTDILAKALIIKAGYNLNKKALEDSFWNYYT